MLCLALPLVLSLYTCNAVERVALERLRQRLLRAGYLRGSVLGGGESGSAFEL